MTVTDITHCPSPTVAAPRTHSAHGPEGPRTGAPLLPVVGGDTIVPLVTGDTRRYANLDYAASAPSLRAVADHVAEILPYYASVHRGAGYGSQISTRLYEGARPTVARFVGARDDDVVVFTRNTTDSLNLLQHCVPDGRGDVVILDVEHHANLLPWQAGAHRVVAAAPSLERTIARLESELVNRPAALVAVTGASNVTGEQLPLGRLAGIAHRHGARLCVDAAQLAPHRRIDLVASDVDYVAFSGHKVYAPFGSGVLVGPRDWLDAAPPYLAGGGAVREVTTEGTTWADAPARHEAGSPNVVGVAALAKACEVIDALPEGALEAHESLLRSRLVAGLTALPGIRVHRIWPDSASSVGVVSFSVDSFDPGLVAAYLSAEHGIGVRDGRFCAHPLLARLGLPEGAVRASFGLGSTAEDVDRLVAALEQLTGYGTRWAYEVVDGRCVPHPDPRPLPDFVPSPSHDTSAHAGGPPCAQPIPR